jgi:hypothetical protein
MEIKVKDSCNDCPFFELSFGKGEISAPCMATCRFMYYYDRNPENSEILMLSDLAQTVHIPDRCPLRKESITVKLEEGE